MGTGQARMFADLVHFTQLDWTPTTIPEPVYANGGHDANGDGSVYVPTQGFNVFASVQAATCAGDNVVGNIYCLGKYKDDGDNDANSAASYIGREWSDLAPFD